MIFILEDDESRITRFKRFFIGFSLFHTDNPNIGIDYLVENEDDIDILLLDH